MNWVKFILVFTSSILCALSDGQIPICTECTCVFNGNEPPADVTCIRPVKTSILSTAFWKNAQNESYQYSRITYNYNHLENLNFEFPENNVTYLNLAYSGITTIGDGVFRNLENLETLVLSFNNLDTIKPDNLKGLYLEGGYMPLRSLKELRLDNNLLHTLNKDVFEHTTDIILLDLSHNPFEVLDKHTVIAITDLAYLKELYLSNTKITTLPDNMMHTQKYLTVLDLSGNPIEKVPATLGEAKNLSVLNLNQTAFGNLTTQNGFPDIPSLKVLHLCGLPNLHRIEQGSMSGLTNLEVLHVHDNALTNFDSFCLAKANENGVTIWPPITKLYLQNNKLSYLNSDLLSRWDALKELDLSNNPWTCECENQWLVDDLMPTFLKIDEAKAKAVMCGAPIEMVKYSLYDLHVKNYDMRCLDEYGSQPENDALMLVGMLAGVLIAIPLILLIMLAYQRRWLGGILSCCDRSPASYSRRFYSATSNQDEYM